MKLDKKTKFFHYSPKRLHIDTLLKNGEEGVFLTTSPVPHHTIANRAIERGGHIYQVKPLGKLHWGHWDDLYCHEGATVIRYVGNARGLIINFGAKRRHFSYDMDDHKVYAGSFVKRRILNADVNHAINVFYDKPFGYYTYDIKK